MPVFKRNSVTRYPTTAHGQSMIEVAVALPFILLVIIALIELGIVFGSYVSLVNAAREGAVFATMYRYLADTSCGSAPNPSCIGAHDNDYYGGAAIPGSYTGTVTIWNEYVNRVENEVFVATGEPLKAGELLSMDALQVDRPVLGPVTTSCPTRYESGCLITVTVHYRLHTMTSDMSLPVPRVKSNVPSGAPWTQWFFSVIGNVDWTGWRMGLPNYYQLDYSVVMPLR